MENQLLEKEEMLDNDIEKVEDICDPAEGMTEEANQVSADAEETEVVECCQDAPEEAVTVEEVAEETEVVAVEPEEVISAESEDIACEEQAEELEIASEEEPPVIAEEEPEVKPSKKKNKKLYLWLLIQELQLKLYLQKLLN